MLRIKILKFWIELFVMKGYSQVKFLSIYISDRLLFPSSDCDKRHIFASLIEI